MYIKCKTCGKEFQIYKCREGYTKYCSKECRMPNLAGKHFGRLTALGVQRYKNGVRYEKCLCDCGNEKWIQRRAALHGTTLSCGCLRKEVTSEMGKRPKTHGCTHTRLYKIYRRMVERCNGKWCTSYKNYGGRGIKVERDTFEKFRDDMEESYNEHVLQFGVRETTIDRINVDGNYCKENCRWATAREQSNNKRTNKMVTYKGKTMSVSDLCREYKVPYGRTQERLKRGWSIEDSIELPEVPQSLHKKGKDFIINYLRECKKK